MDFGNGIAAKSAKLPHWYDVNYAYSGLHSIIHPPPNEVDIWGTIIIPIFQLNRTDAECTFCFDNYAELTCQFYRYRAPEFLFKKRQRAGKWIVCECCDYTDDEADSRMLNESGAKKMAAITAATTTSTATTSTDDDGEFNSKPNEKRAKLNVLLECERATGETLTNKLIQPGWYGKGYRKLVRRRRRKPKLPPLVSV